MICIEIYEGQWCDVHDELPQSISATLQSIARRFWEHCRFYAEDGYVWRPEPLRIPALASFPLSRWMLDTGFYNPTRALPMRYTPVGQFTLADLKPKIFQALFVVLDHHFYPGDERDSAASEIRAQRRPDHDPWDQLLGADSFMEVYRAACSILSSVRGHSPNVLPSLGISPPSLLPPYW